MDVQFGPNSVDLPDLLYKLQRKFKVFNTNDPLPNRGYNYVASSSKYGIVFIASPLCTLSIYYLKDLIDKECEPLYLSVKLHEKPTHIAVSCDQELLAVTGGQMLYVYKIVNFQNQNSAPVVSIKCETNPSTFVSTLQWNPCMPETIAIAFFDGTLLVAQISTIQVKKIQSNARCLCWSPRGKQLVVGNSDGSLCQYKPDLTSVKAVPAPNLFEGAPAEALAIHWISTYQFAVIYKNSSNNSRPSVTLINTPKGLQPSCLNYEDICYSMGSNRPWFYYLQGLMPWNLILASSSNSMEIATLGSEDGVTWLQYCQSDEARPELPLTDKKQENYPVGICIDTCAIHQLPWGENSTLPHMPLLLVVSHTGMLSLFNVINLKKDAAQVCSPPQQLTLPAEIMTSSIPDDAPIQPPPPAHTSTPMAQPKPQAAPAAPPAPAQPPAGTLAAMLSAPPMLTTSMTTQITQAFGAGFGSQPFQKQQQEKIEFKQPAPSQPLSLTKPQSTAPTSQGSKPQPPVTQASKPQPPAQTQALSESEIEAINRSKALKLKTLLIKEVNEFQMELYKFRVQTRDTMIGHQQDLDSIELKLDLLSLDGGQLKRLCALERLHGAVVQLKLELVRACAAVAEARTHAQAKDIYQWTQTDPLTAKRIASVKQLAYYVQSQMERAQRALEHQWSDALGRDPPYDKPGQRMIRPLLDDIYQPLVRQQEILGRQQAVLRALKSAFKECDAAPVFRSASLLRTTPFKKDPLSKLTKNILNMSIEPQSDRSGPPLSPHKLDALRDTLANRKTVPVKPVNVEYQRHAAAARLTAEKSLEIDRDVRAELGAATAQSGQDRTERTSAHSETCQPPAAGEHAQPPFKLRRHEVSITETLKPIPEPKPDIIKQQPEPPTAVRSFAPLNKNAAQLANVTRTLFADEEPKKEFAVPKPILAQNQPLPHLSKPQPIQSPPQSYFGQQQFGQFQLQSHLGQSQTQTMFGKPDSNQQQPILSPPQADSKPILNIPTPNFGFAPPAPTTKASTRSILKDMLQSKTQFHSEVKTDANTFMGQKICSPTALNTSTSPPPTATASPPFSFASKQTPEASSVFTKFQPQVFAPESKAQPLTAFKASSESGDVEPVKPLPLSSKEIKPMTNLFAMKTPTPLATSQQNVPDVLKSNSQSSAVAENKVMKTVDQIAQKLKENLPKENVDVPQSKGKQENEKENDPNSGKTAVKSSLFSSVAQLSTSSDIENKTVSDDGQKEVKNDDTKIEKPKPIVATASTVSDDRADTVSKTPTSFDSTTPVSPSHSIFGTSTTPTSQQTSLFGTSKSSPSVTSAPTSPSSSAASPSASSLFAAAVASQSFGPTPAKTSTSASVFAASSTPATTAPSAFSSVSSRGSIFGTASAATTASVFGTASSPSVFSTPAPAPASAASVFAAASQSVFGSTPPAVTTTSVFASTQAPVFGGAATSTNQSVFSTPAVTSQSSLFGAPTTTAQSVFAGAQTSVFGSPTKTDSTSIFGAAVVEAFGGSTPTTQAAQASVFGTQSQPSQASIFGTPTKTTQVSVFGTPTATTQASVFGTPTATTQASVFGTPTATTQASVFGTPTATTQASVFGTPTATTQASVFGTPTATTQASAFGTPTTTTQASVFGTPTATTQASVFGTPTATTQASVFGTPTATTQASLFGTPPATTQASLFGTPPPATTQSGSIFGGGEANLFASASISTTSAPTQNSGSIFGGSNNTTNVFGGKAAFGQTNPTTAAIFGGGSSFGQKPATNFWGSSGGSSTSGESIFGGGSFTGQQPTSQPSSMFGGGAGSFSAPSPAGQGFGAPTQGAFGSPTQQAGSAFGAAPAFGSKPVFGQSAGFGSPTGGGFGSSFGAFNKSPSSSGFGGPASFGGGASFGGSAFGGTSPSKMFGGGASPSFAVPTQSNATFENLATQNTLTFGNLAQQTPQQPAPAPSFNTSPSFTSWRS